MPRITKARREVPLSEAGRKLPALVRQLPDAGGRIALTVRGQVRAFLVEAPEGGNDADAAPSARVERLVRKALKAARE